MTWLTRTIVAVLAISALSSCRRSRHLGPPKAVAVREDGALQLRITSFNIRYENDGDTGDRSWPNRIPKTVRIIRDIDPDVVGIQEAYHGQAADLWASLPGFDFHGCGRDDGLRAGEYSGIFYRRDRFQPDPSEKGDFWLSETPNQPGSMTWGNTLPRMASWIRLTDRSTSRSFYVFNTHWDHRSQNSRERAAVLIASKIDNRLHPDEPVLLLGDFNSVEENAAVAYLRGDRATLSGSPVSWQNHLIDVFQTLHPSQADRRTFHPWNGDRSGNFKLDYIFASQGVRILEADIYYEDAPFASDHYPVTATLVFPESSTD